MAVAFVRDLPGVTAEAYDAVVAEIGLDKEPAAGLIFHTAGQFNGVWREIDVWESREAWDTFDRDRIMPAVIRELGDAAQSGPPPPEPRYMEVHDVIHGSRVPGST